jgi:acetolactate synthase-1/2/3 large subunit
MTTENLTGEPEERGSPGPDARTPAGAVVADPSDDASAPSAPAAVATRPESGRGRHVPAFGTAEAEAVEKARSDMLRDGKPLNRTRIGADALCEALVRQGVEVIFGYPGGVILPLYDVWADHPELRTILVRHEQGAAHAADGYARASGRVGVCLGTSGPGATNLVTGIATAQLDSVPMVAITGNVPGALIGKDAFQEIDISGITLPMTKHNYLVRKADDIPRVIAEAFHIARTGRPGPVHVDLTKDALTSETQAQHPDTLDLPGFKPRFDGHPRQITLAAREIAEARRPVILAGHGVLIANASDELRQLAEKAQIPVTHTLLGVGAMDEQHPLAYGYMGMHGWKHVNKAIQSADLLIALGMRFDDRVTGTVSSYAPHARIIHVDVDPSEIGKNVAVDVPIVGDVGSVLRALIAAIPQVDPADRAEYLGQLAEWRTESEAVPWHGSGGWRQGILTADYVIARLGELTGHDATLVSDVGQHQMWLARYAGFRRPNSHLSSGGLGTMGYGLPAAMGAALGRGRRWPADDDPGDAHRGRRGHPGQGGPHGQQEAGHDPPVAGDRLRGQLPLLGPAGAQVGPARRSLWLGYLQGHDARRGRWRHPRRPGA